MPGVPSAWQDWQPPCLIACSQAAWLGICPTGKSLSGGTRIIENQYIAG
jgi:hypothetical protein